MSNPLWHRGSPKMLNRSTEKGNVEQTGSETKPAVKDKWALQQLATMKGLYEACGVPILGPPELTEAPDLPQWAANICGQLHRTIFKRLLDLNPNGRPESWRDLGRLLGVCQRQFTFLENALRGAKEVPPAEATDSPETNALAVPPPGQWLSFVQDALKHSIVEGLAQTPAEQNDFLSGLAEGYELFLDAQGQFAGDKGRTAVYFALLAHWMEIEEMREARPRKSCLDLYKRLAPGLGDSRCERFEWFNGVCKEIHLGLGTPGRPQKIRRK